jgi:hypothetical protein
MAARGTRRGRGTDLPISKGPGTRGDIDYLVPHSSVAHWYKLFLPMLITGVALVVTGIVLLIKSRRSRGSPGTAR